VATKVGRPICELAYPVSEAVFLSTGVFVR
jgi:hypothetical protein